MAKKEMEKEEKGLTVKKEEDFSEWYTQVVQKAQLADYSPVSGCMVIRPTGYAIWEKIKGYFNARLEELGIKNAYFPLFIPESFFKKEAQHVKGFAPEVAWVTQGGDKKLKEKLAVRPTSETIMYAMYAKWIRSWRDLPFRLNQWANIVRWEFKYPKLFLRTREFLWQEGHCVYATKEEADKETLNMLKEYQKLAEDILAIPVILGKKSEKEKFAGAEYTTTIEALMPDGKSLQMGTSHQLGQTFAKTFNIRFVDKNEKTQIPWQTSWGFSTRLIGAVVMSHGDDKGLIMPPAIAPTQTVIVPILFKKAEKIVLSKAKQIKDKLKNFSVILDDRKEYTPGYKFHEWELKGVPLRLEIGPQDIKKGQVVLVRRDSGKKQAVKIKALEKTIKTTLEDIQKKLFAKAKRFLKENIVEVKNWNEFVSAIKNKKLVKAAWCDTTECEDWIKDKTQGAKNMCIPFDQPKKIAGKCAHCGKSAKVLAYFAKSC